MPRLPAVLPSDPEGELTRALTPEQSRAALERYVEAVVFQTPPVDGKVPPDPDAKLEEAARGEVWVESEWTRDSHGRFARHIESADAPVLLPDGTRVKRDPDGTYRVVRQGDIRRGFTAAEAARDALDRSARSRNHPDAVGGQVRHASFEDFLKTVPPSDVPVLPEAFDPVLAPTALLIHDGRVGDAAARPLNKLIRAGHAHVTDKRRGVVQLTKEGERVYASVLYGSTEPRREVPPAPGDYRSGDKLIWKPPGGELARRATFLSWAKQYPGEPRMAKIRDGEGSYEPVVDAQQLSPLPTHFQPGDRVTWTPTHGSVQHGIYAENQENQSPHVVRILTDDGQTRSVIRGSVSAGGPPSPAEVRRERLESYARVRAEDGIGVTMIRQRMGEIQRAGNEWGTEEYKQVGALVRAEAERRTQGIMQGVLEERSRLRVEEEELRQRGGGQGSSVIARRLREINQERAALRRREPEGESWLQVLSEIRPFGGKPDIKGSSRIQPMMEEVARYLPSDWIESANRRRVLSLRASGGRGYYQDTNYNAPGALISCPHGRYATALHELGHWAEKHAVRTPDDEPQIVDVCKLWRRRRVAKDGEMPPKVRLQQVLPGHGYKRDEVTWPDEFAHAYVGKDYAGRETTEVLTMGLEAIFFNRHNIRERDPEHVDLVTGLLAAT